MTQLTSRKKAKIMRKVKYPLQLDMLDLVSETQLYAIIVLITDHR